MYVKCTRLCILFEKLCTLNIQNYIRSLKIFLYWTYKMVYITWKFVYFEYTIGRVLADDIYIYIYAPRCIVVRNQDIGIGLVNWFITFQTQPSCAFFENVCRFNIQNYVHPLKKFSLWIYIIFFLIFFNKMCTLNV